jgi:hypothetical protein
MNSFKFEKVGDIDTEILPMPKVCEKKCKIPKNLPATNCLIIAPSHSGKSVLINNLLLRDKFKYKEHFDVIHLISPTIWMDDSYKLLHQYIEKQRSKREKMYKSMVKQKYKPSQIPPEYHPDADKIVVYDKYDESYIQGIMDNKEQDEKILIILDDCATELKGANQKSVLERVFLRGRHENVWCWISSQKYTKVVPSIRVNSPTYIIFKVNNKELDKIADELAEDSIDEFKQIYKKCTEEKYSFMYIDVKSNERYCKRFSHKVKKSKTFSYV